MRKWLCIFALMAAGAIPAYAGETVPALDVALDAPKYDGKVLTITGCKLYGVELDGGPCAVYRKGKMIDAIGVQFSNMPKRDRLKYVDRCGAFDPGKKCFVNITGKIEARGYDAFIYPQKIEFQNEK